MAKLPKTGGSKPKPAPTIHDPRFAGIATDARFRLPSKKQTVVQLDSRFSRLLKDDDFSQKAKVDRYGRKVKSSEGKKELKKMYQLQDSDEDEDSLDESDELKSDSENEGESDRSESDQEGSDDKLGSDAHAKHAAPLARKHDPARDGGFSSSEDDDSDSDSDESEELDEGGEDVAEAVLGEDIQEGEVTSRIAIVNLDWDFIRSLDIMAVASSFAPQGGRVLKVSIYPSEFGRERMQREETEGPPRELFQKKKSRRSRKQTSSDSEESEEESSRSGGEENGEDFDPSVLRRYQLERLRYYYAVITTSSPETAKVIYDTMDGREYLSSANFFDLRFVPDEVTFDEDPRDECTEVPVGYKPREFVTQALRHSKVQLSWDADDSSRKEIMRKAFDQAGELDNDLRAYLGSDSSENENDDEDEHEATRRGHRELLGISDSDYSGDEDDDDELTRNGASKSDKAALLRAALGLAGDAPHTVEKGEKTKEKKRPVGNMEITFVPALAPGAESDDEADKNEKVFVNQPDTETSLEKYIRKEKERKARRKEKLKAEKPGQSDGNETQAASTAPAQKSQATEDLGFNDPFFDNPEQHARQEAKKAKKAKREEKEREAEKLKAEKQREARELELLMTGDSVGGGANMQHFDMKEIIKQQKVANRKGKGKKGKKGTAESEDATPGATDDFQINVSDPRFQALYDSHEFAIDPTNPRFVASKGMKTLMDERRNKRKVDEDDLVPDRGEKKKLKNETAKPKKDELLKLVASVKSKAGRG